MKRVGNLYDAICSIENIRLADATARKGKKRKYGIIIHDRNKEANIEALHRSLVEGIFRTSPYRHFVIREPKERLISRLPYYPDRIVHHAVMSVLEPHLVGSLIRDTFSCIKGRGIHDGAQRLTTALRRDQEGTRYCLKMDISKFYPSVDNTILKTLLRRKFKDNRLLALLDEIIDSAKGLPIGNYLSQNFANFYLNYFDHYVKEVLGVKYYYRYCDDMVVLASNTDSLHHVREKMAAYLEENLNLTMKGNYQVFPVDARGIDFLGYVFYHDHTRLRKSIKQHFARKMSKARGERRVQVLGSYKGWCMHADCRNLYKTITGMKLFKDLGVTVDAAPMTGEKIKINKVLNKQVEVVDFELNTSKFNQERSKKCLKLQIRYEDELRVIFTGSSMLVNAMSHIKKEDLPFLTTIVESNGFYQFT